MSFNNDPFRHLNLVQDKETGLYQWECESCGGGWREPARPAQTSVLIFVESFNKHLRESHNLKPEDTIDWH